MLNNHLLNRAIAVGIFRAHHLYVKQRNTQLLILLTQTLNEVLKLFEIKKGKLSRIVPLSVLDPLRYLTLFMFDKDPLGPLISYIRDRYKKILSF